MSRLFSLIPEFLVIYLKSFSKPQLFKFIYKPYQVFLFLPYLFFAT